MTLRESLSTSRLPILPKLPDLPKVASEALELAKVFGTGGKQLSGMDAEALVRRIRAALSSGKWGDISFREWKSAVWVAFNGEKPLADESGFLDQLIMLFRSRRKRTAYQGLILAYLKEFDPTKPAILRVAQELEGAVQQFDWAWSGRHDRCRLFAPDEAPNRIADACLAPQADPRSVLDSLGMGGGRMSGGMASHAWLRAVNRMRATLSHQTPNVALFDAVLRWSVADGSLLYPSHRSALASALLMPWTERPPTEDIKEKISAFLLEYLKDPRLPINAKEWLGVPDEAVAVLRKWLTGVALEQFFEVVDQVAQEHMWRFRRAFWLAYYNADVINDAWVLFGPEARNYARDTFGKTQSYGSLEKGYQVQSDHSVLLMKIGKLTIADWSHNGKCHIWLDGNGSSPKLYLNRYSRSDVVRGSDNDGQVHHGSDYGTWQRQVAAYIRTHTGISLSEKNYMPDGWRR